MGNIHTLISDTEAEMLRHFPLPLCVLTLEEDSGNARLLIASDAACEFFSRDREHLSDIMRSSPSMIRICVRTTPCSIRF